MMRPWWEHWPGILEKEKEALEEKGWRYAIDETAMRRGVLEITVDYPVSGRIIRLKAIYPDSYPYFRFEVFADQEVYGRHQNPLTKGLCLLERATDKWEVGDTLAGVISTQVPNILASTAAGNSEDISELEDHQAEPFSAYFNYDIGSVLIDSEWDVPPEVKSGFLDVGVKQPVGTQVRVGLDLPVIQAAVLAVLDEDNRGVITAPRDWSRLFGWKRFKARWIWLEQPPEQPSAWKFSDALRQADERRDANPGCRIGQITLRITACLFPEQHQYRAAPRLGWIFAADFERAEYNHPSSPLHSALGIQQFAQSRRHESVGRATPEGRPLRRG